MRCGVILGGAFLLSVVFPGFLQAASSIWAPPPLAEIIEEGMAQNQEIRSLEDQVAGQKELIPFAGSLEDPRAGFAMLNVPTDTFSLSQEPMTQKQLFIAQKIPWFGKLSLRSQRQALIATRQQWLLEARKLELARHIAASYYELGFNGRGLEINERLTNLVRELLQVAETRYAAGSGLQQDVLEAQVELSNLLDEKIVLERQRSVLEDRLNELLNREQFAPVTPPGRLRFPDLTFDAKALQALSLERNPRLWGRRAEADQAAVEIDLAKKEYWPDMDYKLAYGQRDKDFTGRDLPDFVTGSVTVNIPLWHKTRQDRQLEAARKRSEAAAKSFRNLVAVLPHQVDSLVSEIRNFQENFRLYDGALVLQAEQWARTSLAAYNVGKVEFDTMIRAQIRVLRFELQGDRYLFTIYQKRAELEEILGGPLPTQGSGDR